MSNAGGNKMKPGAISGVVLAQRTRGVYTAEFDPQFGVEDIAAWGQGAVSTVQNVVQGVVSTGQNISSGVVSGVVQAASQMPVANVYVNRTPSAVQAGVRISNVPAVPKITVPTFAIPKFDLPKFDLPKITFSTPDFTKLFSVAGPATKVILPGMGNIGGAAMGFATNLFPTIGVTAKVTSGATPAPDFVGGLFTSGSDFLKGLPGLGAVRDASQLAKSAVTYAGLLNPFTAPISIASLTADYVTKNVLGGFGANGNTGVITKPVTPVTSTFDSRMAAVPQPINPDSIPGCTLGGICNPKRNTYGEDHSLAECTIHQGQYTGFVKRYKYNETFPTECLAAGEKKFYVPLGNYKQQEVIGVPTYEDNGRITWTDADTGQIIYDANQELLASGAMSIDKPNTSLVYQVWSNEAPVGVAGKDYSRTNADRFNITGFRDTNSKELEKQVNNLNKTPPAADSYLKVGFSRLGAEAYGGKVLPIDGRKLDKSWVDRSAATENIVETYTDLGQAALGAKVAPGMVTGSNLKAAAGFPAATVECGFWDIGCKVGKFLAPVQTAKVTIPGEITGAVGFAGNTALVFTEGVLGGLPSLADAAYDTTTGGIEKLRGLKKGTLTRLGSRAAFDKVFETSLKGTTGLTLDKNAYVKALGLEYKEGESWLTGAERMTTEFGQDVLTDPTSFWGGVGVARFILAAPAIGEDVGGFITGAQPEDVKYTYMLNNGEFTQVENPSTTESTVVIRATIPTDNPALVGKIAYTTEVLPVGARVE